MLCCDRHLTLRFYGLLQKDLFRCLKEIEVWQKVVSTKIIVTTLVTQGLQPSFLSCPGSGCKKHVKIKGIRNYYFKTIGYCSRTKVKRPLILRRFETFMQPGPVA